MAGIPLSQSGSAILYLAPSTSTRIVAIKRPSFAKGEFPAHLKTYAGQARNAPVACKGKKGQSYRECLIRETKSLKR